MRNKIKNFLLFLLLMLFAFTCAQAAVNSDEEQQKINSIESTFFFDEFANLTYGYLGYSKANASADNSMPYFILPSSLHIIEDSAFEGTALVSIDLPESVTYIGDNAFANIPTLLTVHIPDATQFIGKDAFVSSDHVTITASSNSYARTWAKDNGFRFQLLTTITANNGSIQYSIQSDSGFRSSRKERTETTDNQGTNNIRERRTGRTVGELKASRYKGIAAMHIQSRYFP